MDEQYELISKRKIQEYKDEIAQLKEELEKAKIENKNTPKQEIQKQESVNIKEIIAQIQIESKQEREIITSQLEDIKDLNKKTLDNILNQNLEFTNRFEHLLETLKHLTSTLSEMLDELPNQNTTQITTMFDEIKLSLKNNQNKYPIENSPDNLEILAKLEEIEIFMKNLRILLSYVKPSDIVIDKPKI